MSGYSRIINKSKISIVEIKKMFLHMYGLIICSFLEWGLPLIIS